MQQKRQLVTRGRVFNFGKETKEHPRKTYWKQEGCCFDIPLHVTLSMYMEQEKVVLQLLYCFDTHVLSVYTEEIVLPQHSYCVFSCLCCIV